MSGGGSTRATTQLIRAAFETAYSHDHLLPQETRERALLVLEQEVANKNDGWKLCIEIFIELSDAETRQIENQSPVSQYADEMKFWCLNMIATNSYQDPQVVVRFLRDKLLTDVLPQRLRQSLQKSQEKSFTPLTLTAATDQSRIKQIVGFGFPPYLFKSCIRLYIRLLISEYPHRWPEAWTGLVHHIRFLASQLREPVATSETGALLLAWFDTFCMLLESFDTDVVVDEMCTQSMEERKQAMALKDAMRLHDVVEICELLSDALSGKLFNMESEFQGWYRSVQNESSPNFFPESWMRLVLKEALTNLARLASWIDLPILLRPKFMDPPRVLILCATHSAHAEEEDFVKVSVASLEFLNALVVKKMDSSQKATLLEGMALITTFESVQKHMFHHSARVSLTESSDNAAVFIQAFLSSIGSLTTTLLASFNQLRQYSNPATPQPTPKGDAISYVTVITPEEAEIAHKNVWAMLSRSLYLAVEMFMSDAVSVEGVVPALIEVFRTLKALRVSGGSASDQPYMENHQLVLPLSCLRDLSSRTLHGCYLRAKIPSQCESVNELISSLEKTPWIDIRGVLLDDMDDEHWFFKQRRDILHLFRKAYAIDPDEMGVHFLKSSLAESVTDPTSFNDIEVLFTIVLSALDNLKDLSASVAAPTESRLVNLLLDILSKEALLTAKVEPCHLCGITKMATHDLLVRCAPIYKVVWLEERVKRELMTSALRCLLGNSGLRHETSRLTVAMAANNLPRFLKNVGTKALEGFEMLILDSLMGNEGSGANLLSIQFVPPEKFIHPSLTPVSPSLVTNVTPSSVFDKILVNQGSPSGGGALGPQPGSAFSHRLGISFHPDHPTLMNDDQPKLYEVCGTLLNSLANSDLPKAILVFKTFISNILSTTSNLLPNKSQSTTTSPNTWLMKASPATFAAATEYYARGLKCLGNLFKTFSKPSLGLNETECLEIMRALQLVIMVFGYDSRIRSNTIFIARRFLCTMPGKCSLPGLRELLPGLFIKCFPPAFRQILSQSASSDLHGLSPLPGVASIQSPEVIIQRSPSVDSLADGPASGSPLACHMQLIEDVSELASFLAQIISTMKYESFVHIFFRPTPTELLNSTHISLASLSTATAGGSSQSTGSTDRGPCIPILFWYLDFFVGLCCALKKEDYPDAVREYRQVFSDLTSILNTIMSRCPLAYIMCAMAQRLLYQTETVDWATHCPSRASNFEALISCSFSPNFVLNPVNSAMSISALSILLVNCYNSADLSQSLSSLAGELGALFPGLRSFETLCLTSERTHLLTTLNEALGIARLLKALADSLTSLNLGDPQSRKIVQESAVLMRLIWTGVHANGPCQAYTHDRATGMGLITHEGGKPAGDKPESIQPIISEADKAASAAAMTVAQSVLMNYFQITLDAGNSTPRLIELLSATNNPRELRDILVEFLKCTRTASSSTKTAAAAMS